MDCPACGGQLALLGQLGQLVHFRCTGCGLDSHEDAAKVPLIEDDDTVPEFEDAVEGES